MTSHRRSSFRGTAHVVARVGPVLMVPVLIGALVALVAPSAAAIPSGAGPPGDDDRAVGLLERSAAAPDQVSYSGTQYVSAWSALAPSTASSSAVVDVGHEAGGATNIRVHNQQTDLLQTRTAATWLASSGGPAELLAGAYAIRMGAGAKVAGRPADVVEAWRDDGSLAARLWIDRATALSLRRETFATDGTLLSASAFVDVTIGAEASCCEFHDIDDASPAPDTRLEMSDVEDLREEGCHCPGRLLDDLVLYEARRVGDAVQLSYSDGVMTVSVFEQAGRLDPARLQDYTPTDLGGGTVYTADGPPARFTWTTGEQVITVVAEAPLEAVYALIEAVPPEPHAEPRDDGLLARIGRGAGRVVSWLNPFD